MDCFCDDMPDGAECPICENGPDFHLYEPAEEEDE